jgi:hypothetical protein
VGGASSRCAGSHAPHPLYLDHARTRPAVDGFLRVFVVIHLANGRPECRLAIILDRYSC